MRATLGGFRIAIIALIGYWALLFVSTHIPPNPLLQRIGGSDKIIHFGAFACLAFLMAWAIPTTPKRLMQNVVLAGVVCVIYSGVDELLQIPVGRTADWHDFYADCFGVGCGLVFYSWVRWILISRASRLFASSKQ